MAIHRASLGLLIPPYPRTQSLTTLLLSLLNSLNSPYRTNTSLNNKNYSVNMKFANTLILAAMAAVLTNAAPQGPTSGPVTANAEVAVAESCNFGIASDACDCKVCDGFFNKCLKVSPNLTTPAPDLEN